MPPMLQTACSSHNRRIILAGLALLLLAGAMRFTTLGSLDLWEDEVWTQVVSSDLTGKLLRWETPGDPASSPLPWLELKLYRKVLGNTALSLRAPSALYGTLAVGLLFLVVGRFADWRTAFFAGLLLAANPYTLEWTRAARMYGHWLFFALALAGMALWAVNLVRQGRIGPADWRWWCLGFLMMLAHASVTHAILTVGAVGLWLGLAAMVELATDWRGSLRILAGAAIASLAFLMSWSLTGLGKMLTMLGASPSDPAAAWEQLPGHLRNTVTYFTGYLPLWAAIAVWLLAVGGLIVLALALGHTSEQRRRRVMLVTLLVMLALTPLAGYVSIVSRHFFTPRYLLPATLLLWTGLGAAMAWGWRRRVNPAATWTGRGLVLALLLALTVLWWPAWREIYTVPKVAVSQALAPLAAHAQAGDVMTPVPEWYTVFGRWYDLGGVRVIMPPVEGRFITRVADAESVGPGKGFAGDFEAIFTTTSQAPQAPDHATPSAVAITARPPGVWLFVVEPGENLPRTWRVLAAYGVDTHANRQRLLDAASTMQTLTVRVSAQGLEHLVVTPHRRVVK